MRALWVLVVCSLAWADGSKRAEHFRVGSAYLSTTALGAHQITLSGSLGGAGTLELDPNSCGLNEFGDPTVCTRIAARRIPVRLQQVKIADPARTGRRLFAVGGKFPGEAKVFLVVPGGPKQAWRLVVDAGDKVVRRVVTLEPRQGRIVKRRTKLGRGRFGATWRDGAVTLTAAGQFPRAGYKAALEPLPIRIWPPQYKLVWTPPPGPSATVLVPFRVHARFKAQKAPEHVVVHDAKGQHKIRVKVAAAEEKEDR